MQQGWGPNFGSRWGALGNMHVNFSLTYRLLTESPDVEFLSQS
jgi:hypothetical protein